MQTEPSPPPSREFRVACLRDVRDGLRESYARDILTDLLGSIGELDLDAEHAPEPLAAQDADSLFRTLVLDEGWDPDSATVVYVDAMALIGA